MEKIMIQEIENRRSIRKYKPDADGNWFYDED